MKTFKIKKSTATTDADTSSSPSKSSNIDTNSHSSLPVKQSIAIALASKLNKKNTASHSGNDVELPRLIPIASEPTADPFKEQLIGESLHPVLASLDSDHFMSNTDLLLDTSNIVEDVEESILANAVVSFRWDVGISEHFVSFGCDRIHTREGTKYTPSTELLTYFLLLNFSTVLSVY